MTELLIILLVLSLLPFIGKALYPHSFSWGELALNVLIVAAVVSVAYQAGKYAKAMDVEVWNGEVVSKQMEEVSCSHSYSCPPCTESCSGTGSSRSCTRTCSTCYEHFNDYDWVLSTSIGRMDIDRVDRQGKIEPPRFSIAQIGDPVADTRSYMNLIKAAPASLFNTLAEKTLRQNFPQANISYPSKVYDYHYVDRVLTQNVQIENIGQWNKELANSLRKLGPNREVNLIVVFTASVEPQFANALRSYWLGGKKNDVVVVLGTPNYPQIQWARVFSWSDEEVFKVQLRDAILDLKTAEPVSMFSLTSEFIDASFKRKDMKDFAYLEREIDPPGWLIAALLGLGAALSLGLSAYFARHEVI